MNNSNKCQNKLFFSEDLGMELKNNIPTSELIILAKLSKDINQTLIEHKGVLLSTPELGEDSYLLIISTMVIRCEYINKTMIVVDISDVPSYIKRLLNEGSLKNDNSK